MMDKYKEMIAEYVASINAKREEKKEMGVKIVELENLLEENTEDEDSLGQILTKNQEILNILENYKEIVCQKRNEYIKPFNKFTLGLALLVIIILISLNFINAVGNIPAIIGLTGITATIMVSLKLILDLPVHYEKSVKENHTKEEVIAEITKLESALAKTRDEGMSQEEELKSLYAKDEELDQAILDLEAKIRELVVARKDALSIIDRTITDHLDKEYEESHFPKRTLEKKEGN